MKTITTTLWEKGDHFIIDLPEDTEGYRRYYYGGDIGTVKNNPSAGSEQLIVDIEGVDKDGDPRDDFTVMVSELKYITGAEFQKLKKKRKIRTIPKLEVDTLEYPLKVLDDVLEVGCQNVSAHDARKIAKFILKQFPVKRKPAKKVTKKKGRK